jgi:uncharacterized SAM-binding protein YcdF (DUF218 family)
VIWVHRVFLLVVALWVLGFVVFSAKISMLYAPLDTIFTEGIVVFTGESGRIQKALSLAANHPKSYLRISGKSKTSNFQPYASSFISYDAACNTEENLALTHRWIKEKGIKSLRLITSDYHMPRCLMAASQWRIVLLPHPLHLNVESPLRLFRIFKEYNKWLFANILSFLP